MPKPQTPRRNGTLSSLLKVMESGDKQTKKIEKLDDVFHQIDVK